MLSILVLALFPLLANSAVLPVGSNGTTILPTIESTTNSTETVRHCEVDASTYEHREQIPRSDPCELCVCVDSEMYCLWRLCPPAGAPAVAVAASTTAPSKTTNNSQVEMEFTQLITQQREFNAIKEKEKSLQTTTIPTSLDPTSCYVMGVRYRLGEILPRDTGTCLECSCAEGARVTCTPKDCASQPDLDYLQHSNSLDMFDLDTF